MNFKKFILLCVIFGLLIFIFVESLILYNSYKETPSGAFDYIIVLGAYVDGDQVSLSLRYRLDKAIDYMKKEEDIDVVVTGAKGYNEEYTEASVMKQYLVDNGISEQRIICEDKSYSTYENLKNSYDIIGKSKVLISTNDFHMFRALMLADRVGFEAYPLNSKTPTVVTLKLYVREFFAVIKSVLFDR